MKLKEDDIKMYLLLGGIGILAYYTRNNCGNTVSPYISKY